MIKAKLYAGEASRRAGDSLWVERELVQSPLLFEQFLYGLALVSRERKVLHLNRRARALLVPPDSSSMPGGWSCCDLICNRLSPAPVRERCLAVRAGESAEPLPEASIDIEGRSPASAWVTASPVDPDCSQLLFHLRPGRPEEGRRQSHSEPAESESTPRRQLRIAALDRFKIESEDGPLGGEWLEQRPGQLLKYLVSERRRTIPNDRISDALWPEAGSTEGRNRLRYYVHILREKLEPERALRSSSSFVVARRGSYALDLDRVRVDVDDFEREASAGLAAFVQGSVESAALHLDRALSLYGEGYLPEDPYEEWALDERERLHELAGRALRAQVRIGLRSRDFDAAAVHARRLADMEPFDTDVHRLLIDICLRRGRRSEAMRRYSVLRKRTLSSFGEEPDFELGELGNLTEMGSD